MEKINIPLKTRITSPTYSTVLARRSVRFLQIHVLWVLSMICFHWEIALSFSSDVTISTLINTSLLPKVHWQSGSNRNYLDLLIWKKLSTHLLIKLQYGIFVLVCPYKWITKSKGTNSWQINILRKILD